MCSFFWKRMENDQGDLSDIVRASGGGGGSGGSGVIVNNPIPDWQFPSETENFPSGYEESIDDFGDPFSMRDPLLHELDLTSSGFFQSSNSTGLVRTNVEDNNNVSSGSLLAQKILDGEVTRPCNNIFSRMLQISPNSNMPVSPRDISGLEVSTRGIKTSSLVASDMIIKSNSSMGCSMIEKGGVQISSPRNPGIKRRKTQAKKVVCIPAPAASTSRPTGEVVPSDLWAWRKYGQKPIKGSPYPRGYYRCSSSKGCSARKQVERSRNDPNMLVITYTSEHNHPWPTQRNALAGSTRSQPTKNNAASKSSPSSQTQKASNVKEQLKDNNGDSFSTIADRSTMNASVKEEIGEIEKPIDMDDRDFDQGFHHSYRPEFPNTIQSDDFFADLGELEPDPLLLLSQGFSGHKSDEEREDKAMDPFSIFDWTVDNSLGEARRGL